MLLALTFHTVGVRTLSRTSIIIVCFYSIRNPLPYPGSFVWLSIAIPRRVLSRSAAMRRSGQVPSSELWLAKENEGFLRGAGLRMASHARESQVSSGIRLPVQLLFNYTGRCRRPSESRIVLGSRPMANMELPAPDENLRDT